MRIATWMIAAAVMIGAQTLNAGQVFFTDFETADPPEASGYVNRVSTQSFPPTSPASRTGFFGTTPRAIRPSRPFSL